MKLSIANSSLFAVAVAACAVALPASSRAQSLTYHVDLNVASLLTAAAQGPYYLDFQLNGDGLPAAATNSVLVNNFKFSLGSAVGTPVSYENAAGNTNFNVVLSLDSGDTANELYQQFSATTTDIQFDVTSTENASGITPDEFEVAILDKSLGQIATTAPDGVSLVTETINGSVPAPSVRYYRSTTPAGVIASAVPEPQTFAAVLAGLAALILTYRRRKI